jgi:hypothetical protein
VRNWSSVSSVKFTAKSKATHYLAVFLRCSLAVGLMQLGQVVRVVQCVVHGVEQRQIAQLRTTVNVALRKDVSLFFAFRFSLSFARTQPETRPVDMRLSCPFESFGRSSDT